VVKAFNNIVATSLATRGVLAGTPGRICLSVAGDDERAKEVVLGLIEALGFDGIDAGTLADSWRQQPGTPAYCRDLDINKLKAALAKADAAQLAAYRAQADETARAYFAADVKDRPLGNQVGRGFHERQQQSIREAPQRNQYPYSRVEQGVSVDVGASVRPWRLIGLRRRTRGAETASSMPSRQQLRKASQPATRQMPSPTSAREVSEVPLILKSFTRSQLYDALRQMLDPHENKAHGSRAFWRSAVSATHC
jgi:hypothetical protein